MAKRIDENVAVVLRDLNLIRGLAGTVGLACGEALRRAYGVIAFGGVNAGVADAHLASLSWDLIAGTSCAAAWNDAIRGLHNVLRNAKTLPHAIRVCLASAAPLPPYLAMHLLLERLARMDRMERMERMERMDRRPMPADCEINGLNGPDAGVKKLVLRAFVGFVMDPTAMLVTQVDAMCGALALVRVPTAAAT